MSLIYTQNVKLFSTNIKIIKYNLPLKTHNDKCVSTS